MKKTRPFSVAQELFSKHQWNCSPCWGPLPLHCVQGDVGSAGVSSRSFGFVGSQDSMCLFEKFGLIFLCPEDSLVTSLSQMLL